MTFRYYPPTVAGVGMKPGTLLLTEALEDLVGFDIGPSYNRRCVQQCGAPVPVGARTCLNGHGISHHAVCDAVDVKSFERAVHALVTDWALGPIGQAHEVQEIVTGFPPVSTGILGPGRWTVDTGWKPYHGVSSHRDHIHVSQTPHAAARTTPPDIPQEDDDMPATPFRLVRSHGSWKTVAVSSDGSKAIEIPGVDPPTPSPLTEGATAGLWTIQDASYAGMNDDTPIDLHPELFSALTGKAPGGPR